MFSKLKPVIFYFYIDYNIGLLQIFVDQQMGQCCQNQGKLVPQFEPQQLSLKIQRNEEKSKLSDVVSPTNLVEVKITEDDKIQVPPVVKQEKKEEDLPVENKIEEKALVEEIDAVVVEQKKDQFVDFQQYIHLYQKATFFYDNHDLENSHSAIKELETLKTTIKDQRFLSQQEFLAKLKDVEDLLQRANPKRELRHYDQAIIAQIELQMKDLICYENIVDQAPYSEIYNKKGLKISTRQQGKTTGSQLEAEIHVPFEEFVSVLTDVGLFSELVPLCDKSTEIKECGRNSKLGHLVFNMPIVSNRESFIKGCIYSRLKSKGDVIVSVRPLKKEEEVKQGCKHNEDYVSMEFKYFILRYTPISERLGKMNFSFCIEKGLEVVPGFVEKLVLEKFGKELFHNLIKYSTGYKGSQWDKRTQARPALYNFVKQAVKEKLEQQRQEKK